MPNNKSRLLKERLSNFDIRYPELFEIPDAINRQPYLIPDGLLDYLPDAFDMLARVNQYVSYDAVDNPLPDMGYVSLPYYLMDFIDGYECPECPEPDGNPVDDSLLFGLGVVVGAVTGALGAATALFGTAGNPLILPAAATYIEVATSTVKASFQFSPPRTTLTFGGVDYTTYVLPADTWSLQPAGSAFSTRTLYTLNVGRALNLLTISGQGTAAAMQLGTGTPPSFGYDYIIELD